MAALFAADARMVFADGTEVNGRDQIKQSFEAAFRRQPQGRGAASWSMAIRFLTPEVAVEEGLTTMFPDGETLTSRDRYTVLHLKRDGRWQMQSVRIVEEESLSAYGEFSRSSGSSATGSMKAAMKIVDANFRWDENKSFLARGIQGRARRRSDAEGQPADWLGSASQTDSLLDVRFSRWIWRGNLDAGRRRLDLSRPRPCSPTATSASATRRLTRWQGSRDLDFDRSHSRRRGAARPGGDDGAKTSAAAVAPLLHLSSHKRIPPEPRHEANTEAGGQHFVDCFDRCLADVAGVRARRRRRGRGGGGGGGRGGGGFSGGGGGRPRRRWRDVAAVALRRSLALV